MGLFYFARTGVAMHPLFLQLTVSITFGEYCHSESDEAGRRDHKFFSIKTGPSFHHASFRMTPIGFVLQYGQKRQAS
jgi:hypothetical protein